MSLRRKLHTFGDKRTRIARPYRHGLMVTTPTGFSHSSDSVAWDIYEISKDIKEAPVLRPVPIRKTRTTVGPKRTTNSRPKRPSRPSRRIMGAVRYDACRPDEIMNRETGRCVKRSSKLGRQLLRRS